MKKLFVGIVVSVSLLAVGIAALKLTVDSLLQVLL